MHDLNIARALQVGSRSLIYMHASFRITVSPSLDMQIALEDSSWLYMHFLFCVGVWDTCAFDSDFMS